MIIRAITVAAIVAAPFAARAEEPTPELLTAALQAMQMQRDQALNQTVQISAQLSVAQREIARLRRDLDDAKKIASPPDQPK